MDMIRHDDVAPNQPSRGVRPNRAKQLMHVYADKPGLTLVRAHRHKHDDGLVASGKTP